MRVFASIFFTAGMLSYRKNQRMYTCPRIQKYGVHYTTFPRHVFDALQPFIYIRRSPKRTRWVRARDTNRTMVPSPHSSSSFRHPRAKPFSPSYPSLMSLHFLRASSFHNRSFTSRLTNCKNTLPPGDTIDPPLARGEVSLGSSLGNITDASEELRRPFPFHPSRLSNQLIT